MDPRRALRPKKELGQHFLVAPHAIRRIVLEVLETPAGALVEIGPGPGVLTGPLLADGRPLLAVELDPAACALLQDRFGPEAHFQLQQGDAVTAPMALPASYAVVGNLPYNAATAILTRFLVRDPGWERMVLMFQKEVGLKLMNRPGGKDYGPLSVLAQRVAALTRLLSLGPGAFAPPPKVDSVVLRFDPLAAALPVAERAPFLAFLHRAFAQRRKTLVNNLAGLLSAEAARDLLQARGLPLAVRAEALDPATLLDLFRGLPRVGEC